MTNIDDLPRHKFPETVVEVLLAAREVLADESAWTQGANARDLDGKPVASVRSDRAVCFCLSGAIWKVCRPDDNPMIRRVHRAFEIQLGGRSMAITWQDAKRRTHIEVLDLIDRTIEAEREKEAT